MIAVDGLHKSFGKVHAVRGVAHQSSESELNLATRQMGLVHP